MQANNSKNLVIMMQDGEELCNIAYKQAFNYESQFCYIFLTANILSIWL